MSLGTVLDVVIGLVFTYLLLGIIASGFQELWVAIINKRGRELQKAIFDLLSGTGRLSLGGMVFDHALVFGLSPGSRRPSYVPARNFALALMETLRAGGRGPVFSEVEKAVAALPAGNAKQSLTTFVAEAAGDVEALRKSIETWFDDAMDRVSGVYKRYTQCFTLLFGLAAAILFNVDSINLAYTLWTNGPLRDAAVAEAQQYVDARQKQDAAGALGAAAGRGGNQAVPGERAKEPATPADVTARQPSADAAKTRAQTEKNIRDAAALLNKLPVGWVATGDEAKNGKQPSAWQLFEARLFAADGSGGWMVLGWLVTALATSLGAPFWFDALSNLLRLRNTGPKPKRSDASATTS